MTPWERLQEAWCRVRGWYPARVAGRQLRCDPDHISFWSKVDNGSWEPQTFTVLDSILAPGGIHLDVGAWIGPTVLHAAHCSQKVFCFEPDKVAYMYLLANLKLNKLDNVIPFNMAVAEKSRMSRMASPRGKRGDSMTSLLVADRAGEKLVYLPLAEVREALTEQLALLEASDRLPTFAAQLDDELAAGTELEEAAAALGLITKTVAAVDASNVRSRVSGCSMNAVCWNRPSCWLSNCSTKRAKASRSR